MKQICFHFISIWLGCSVDIRVCFRTYLQMNIVLTFVAPVQSPSKNYSAFTPACERTWFAVITSLPLQTFILSSPETTHWLLKQGDGKVRRQPVFRTDMQYKSSKKIRANQLGKLTLTAAGRERLAGSKSSETAGAERTEDSSLTLLILSNLGPRKDHCQTLFQTSSLVLESKPVAR